MRSRNIKPGFFKNEQLAECDPLARLLFAGLWCVADKQGRFEWRSKRIKAEILPYDDCDIETLLNQLFSRGLILKYTVNSRLNNGELTVNGPGQYGWVVHFKDHQRPHHTEAESKLPSPPNDILKQNQVDTDLTVKSQLQNGENPPDSLIPDSHDSLIHVENPEALRLASLLYELIRKNDSKARKPNLKKWANSIDLLIRRDERDPLEIEAVIRWCQQDDFWKSNILSARKMREKFQQLHLQMKRKPKSIGGLKGVPSDWGKT